MKLSRIIHSTLFLVIISIFISCTLVYELYTVYSKAHPIPKDIRVNLSQFSGKIWNSSDFQQMEDRDIVKYNVSFDEAIHWKDAVIIYGYYLNNSCGIHVLAPETLNVYKYFYATLPLRPYTPRWEFKMKDKIITFHYIPNILGRDILLFFYALIAFGAILAILRTIL